MTKCKTPLKHLEMFDLVCSQGLTASEYYLLASMHQSTTTLSGNTSTALKGLVFKQWVANLSEDDTPDYQISERGHKLINKVESIFKVQKEKATKLIVGSNYKENILKYKEMFPNQKLPHGKAARSAYGNLEKNFRWFFENHDFTWEDIFNATAAYINDHQKKNWKFMRTSQYFIRKDNLSDLADMCENIKNGGYKEQEHIIKTKVV